MIGTFSPGKKKESFCDFCKVKSSEESLVTTGKIRYHVDYDDYGKEAICRLCLNSMFS